MASESISSRRALSSIHTLNCLIPESVTMEYVDIFARNLVIYPGADVTFSHCKIRVEKNLVVLGSLNFPHCELNAKATYEGFSGYSDELQEMIGLRESEIAEIVRRIRHIDPLIEEFQKIKLQS